MGGKGVDTGQNVNKDVLLGPGDLVAPERRLPRDAVLIAVLVLASSASFGLGVVAGRESGAGEGARLRIEGPELAETLPEAAVSATSSLATKTGAAPPLQKPAATTGGGQYVASKSGTKYYLPWCGTAKRIKDENKVWFASKAEAEAAGYEPAKNCKGL